MIAVDHPFVAEKNGPFDAVFKLPHVARPVVGHEHVDAGCGYPFDIFAVFLGVLFKEKIGQKKDVGFPFA